MNCKQVNSPAGSWAYFDLDLTFSARSTEPLVTKALWADGWLSASQLARVTWSYVLYEFRLIRDFPETKRRAVRSLLTGLPASEIEAAVDECFQSLLLHLARPYLADELQRHRQAGRRVALLTSTLDLIARPFSRHFGFDEMFAATLEVSGGVYTGAIIGEIPYGEVKAEIVRRHLSETGADLVKCFAYGDHFSDRFFMQEVGNPVAVYPDRKLRDFAARREWQIV